MTEEGETTEKKNLESSEDSKEETLEESKEEINQEKEIRNNDKEISLTEDTSLQQEKKSYINLYFCQISIGIIFAYLYIVISILMNVINRIIFHTYYFKFNFTILFFQQLFCLITFILLSMYSKTYRSKVGEISFNDFQSLQTNYISFTLIFILNNLSGFIGSQLIVNTPMYLTLRKLVLVMIYLYDLLIDKKKISQFTTVCIILVSFGSVLAGIEDFSTDYLGYLIVLIYNSLTVFYNKLTEIFKKKTGVPNLKLLVYNSILSCPILLFLIIVTGEYKKLYKYFAGEKIFDGTYFGLFINLLSSFGFCVALIMSFFISNEKNSSLFTSMLSNSKDIVITAMSYFWLPKTKFTFCIVGGLIISTLGAVMISVKSMKDNMKKKEIKDYAPIKIIEEEAKK
jgi:solute carrier family 35 protein